jgi:hypothetical protein
MAIELTAERARELLNYDPESGALTWRVRRPNGVCVGSVAGCAQPHGYIKVSIDGVQYYAHRIIWLIMTGAIPVEFIDHLNGNRGDNRWANLREASRVDNARNSRIRKTNKCGVKGIYLCSERGDWVANIRVSGRNKTLGRFKTQEEAHAAYCAAAHEHFGEFARFD